MLSRTGEYALQAMVFLAQRQEEGPIASPRIAKDLGIPQKYLSSILADLVRSGILTSNRGKGGGFSLLRPTSKIQLADILAPFEPMLRSTQSPCPFGNPVCSDDEPCGGHQRWKRIKEAYSDFLEKTSLEDVSKEDKPSRQKRAKRRK